MFMGLISWFKDKAFLALEREVILLKARFDAVESNIASIRGRLNNPERKNRQQAREQPEQQDGVPSLSDLPPEFLASLSPDERANLNKVLGID